MTSSSLHLVPSGPADAPDPSAAQVELGPAAELLRVDEGLCTLLGRTQGELLGHSLLEFTHPVDMRRAADVLSPEAAGSPSQDLLEVRILRRDGGLLWIRLTGVWDAHRRCRLSQVVDITEAVEQRQLAAAAARRTRALVEHSADLILVVGPDGRLGEANPAAQAVIDWEAGAPAVDFINDLVHPDDREQVLETFAGVYTAPGPHPAVSFRLCDRAGAWRHLHATANNQLHNPDVAGVVVNVRDVTVEVEQLRATQRNQRAVTTALARVTECRDPHSAGHQGAVAVLAGRIARQLGVQEAELEVLDVGASLHDVGKVAVPAEILTRAGPLTAAEHQLVRAHSQVGYDLLTDAGLAPGATDVVLHHHERIDGSGYPDGLAGDEISLPARIVAVADVLDAMSSDRPHRRSLGTSAAYAEIAAHSGTRYDRDVVAAALAVRQA